MTLEKKTAIEEAMKKEGIAGLYFTDHPSRMYPNGIFSSHFIGYALAENEENDSSGLVGKTGLEAAYDDAVYPEQTGKSSIKRITIKTRYRERWQNQWQR